MMLRWVYVLAVVAVVVPWGVGAQGVLNLTGQASNAKPDILFLAPQLTESPGAYKALTLASEAGTTLPHLSIPTDSFTGGGAISVLAAADYRILPIRDIPWATACQQLQDILELRLKTRYEDNVIQPPICAILTEEVTPEVLAETLPKLLASEALVIVAPQSNLLPTIIAWRNIIWPDHVADAPVTVDHLIPTLAEIVGLPAPAEVEEVSILPLLTACGYQRPLEALPVDSESVNGTELRLYKEHSDTLPWVPDFQTLIPTERQFTREVPPLSAKAFASMSCSRRNETGVYIRTALKEVDWTLPAAVSCVIRVEGRPVYSAYLPTLPRKWSYSAGKPVQIELYLIVPPDFELKHLPLW